jgi:hypothetical protein
MRRNVFGQVKITLQTLTPVTGSFLYAGESPKIGHILFTEGLHGGGRESRTHPSHVFLVTHMIRCSAGLASGRGRRFRSGW